MAFSLTNNNLNHFFLGIPIFLIGLSLWYAEIPPVQVSLHISILIEIEDCIRLLLETMIYHFSLECFLSIKCKFVPKFVKELPLKSNKEENACKRCSTAK